MASLSEKRIGPPIDTFTITIHPSRPYSEDRDIHAYELDINKDGFPFSFLETLQELRRSFPGAPCLEILSGGSGNGRDLGDLKSLGQAFGIPIRTTAVTLEQRNLTNMLSEGVDIPIIDSIQDAFVDRKLAGPYHFVVDLTGAISWDNTLAKDGTLSSGELIVPIYDQVIAPGGLLLLSASYLSEDFPQARQNILNLLEENHFTVVKSGGLFILAARDSSPNLPEEKAVALYVDKIKNRTGILGVWHRDLQDKREHDETGPLLGYGFLMVAGPSMTEDEKLYDLEITLADRARSPETERQREALERRIDFLTDLGIDEEVLLNVKEPRWKRIQAGNKIFWYCPTAVGDVFLVRTIQNNQYNPYDSRVHEHIYRAPTEIALMQYLGLSD